MSRWHAPSKDVLKNNTYENDTEELSAPDETAEPDKPSVLPDEF